MNTVIIKSPVLKNELNRWFSDEYLNELELEIFSNNISISKELEIDVGESTYAAQIYFIEEGYENFICFVLLSPKNKSVSISKIFPALIPEVTTNKTIKDRAKGLLADIPISDLGWVLPVVYCESHDQLNQLWFKLIQNEKFVKKFDQVTKNKISDKTNALDFLFNTSPSKIEDDDTIGIWFSDPCYFGKIDGWPFHFMDQENSFLKEIGSIFKADVCGSIYRPLYTDYFNLVVPVINYSIEDSDIFKSLRLEFEFQSPTHYLNQDIGIGLAGYMGFNVDSRDIDLAIRGTWFPKKETIYFKADCKFSNLPFFNLEDFEGLEANAPSAEIGLGILVSKKDLFIQQLDFSFELNHWHLIPEIIHLEQLKFDVEIWQPEKYRLVRAKIGAIALIGKDNKRLICSASYPNGLFTFRLDPSTPLKIHEIVSAFTGSNLHISEQLAIHNLYGSYNIKTKFLDFGIGIDNGEDGIWNLHGFKLKEIGFNLRGTIGDLSISLKAKLLIETNDNKSVDIPVKAMYMGSGKGWIFSGAIIQRKSDNQLTIADFIQHVSGKKIDLIQNQSLAIKSLDFSYQTKSKYLEFNAESSGDINIDIPFFDSNKNALKISDLQFNLTKQESTLLHFLGTGKFPALDNSLIIDVHYKSEKVKKEEKETVQNTWKLIANPKDQIKWDNISAWLKKVIGIAPSLPPNLESEGSKWTDIYFKFEKGETESIFSVNAKLSNFKIANLKDCSLLLHLEISHGEPKFTGQLLLGETPNQHAFQIDLGREKGQNILLLQYIGELTFQDVIGIFDHDNKVISLIPDWINPSMKESLIFYKSGKSNDESNFIFGTSINPMGEKGIDLSNLEFVGKYIPKTQSKLSLTVDILYSTNELKKEDFEVVKKLKPPTSNLEIPMGLKGLNVKANIKGDFLISDSKNESGSNDGQLDLSITKSDTSSGSDNEDEKVDKKTTWKKVSKKLGPVVLDQVGFTMEDGKAKMLINGGLKMGGFSFNLLGFGVKVPLRPNIDVLKDIEFGLDGLELKMKKGKVDISGAFYKQMVSLEYNSKHEFPGFAGEIVVKIGGKSLRAFGAYVNLDGKISFFLYAVAIIPLGGPAEFFIDGFAGGFGINSRLNIPKIKEVRNFIMVKSAFGDSYLDSDDQSSTLSRVFKDIPPAPDQYWIAVGIKANHYKFVESFMLAAISFGDKFELDLLGLARLKMPEGSESLAKAELAIHAHFEPDNGILRVEAQITDGSYVINPMAKLSGGFAFYSWFKGKHKGDFVITLGGYNPNFKKPDHYPNPPRLELNYQVTENIYIVGTAYFALTPKIFMAGGRLEGTADLGMVQAWFEAEAHFTMNLSPVEYYLECWVKIGAKFTIKLGPLKASKTIQVSAKMEFWGPNFGGITTVDLAIVDFVISFGSPRKPALPISWDKFEELFLPPRDEMCMISISDGVLKELKSDIYNESKIRYLVTPADLKIGINSCIPIKENKSSLLNEKKVAKSPTWEVGVAPVNIYKEQFNPILVVSFERHGFNKETGAFKLFPINERVPSSLWGEFANRDLKSEQQLIGGEKPPMVGVELYPIKKDSKEFAREIDKIGLESVILKVGRVDFINSEALNLEIDRHGKAQNTYTEIFKQPNKEFIKSLLNSKEFVHLKETYKYDQVLIESDIEFNQLVDSPLLQSIGSNSETISWEPQKV